MLSYNNQFGPGPPLPLLCSRMFLSVTYTSTCLACSFSLPISTHVYNFHDCSLREFLTPAPSERLPCPGHAPTLREWWAPCPLPDSAQPAPPTTSSHASSRPHASFSSSSLLLAAFSIPHRQQRQELAQPACLAAPRHKRCPGQDASPASPALLLQQHGSHLSADLSAWLPPTGKEGWRKSWQHERTYLVLQRRRTNTDPSCSFTALQNSPAPSSCSSTPHHSDPSPLGAEGLGSSDRQVGQSSPYPLHPPAEQQQGSRSDAFARSRAPGQAKDPSFPPLSNCVTTSFLHPSPVQHVLYSSLSKDQIYVFNSFRN